MNDMMTLLLIAIPSLYYLVLGFVTPSRVAVATATVTIEAPIEWLFHMIAIDRRQAFRSDLKDVIVTSNKRWRELAFDSPPVDYEEVRSVTNHLFEAHFKGFGFRGTWLVRFTKDTDKVTTLFIYEEIQVKQPLLRPIVKLIYPLQDAVNRFVADLFDAIDVANPITV